MNDKSGILSLENGEKIIIGLFVLAGSLLGFAGITFLLHHEGYFCTPVIQSGNTITINAWCGHDGKIIQKNGKTFWQVNGTNFGDGFP